MAVLCPLLLNNLLEGIINNLFVFHFFLRWFKHIWNKFGLSALYHVHMKDLLLFVETVLATFLFNFKTSAGSKTKKEIADKMSLCSSRILIKKQQEQC